MAFEGDEMKERAKPEAIGVAVAEAILAVGVGEAGEGLEDFVAGERGHGSRSVFWRRVRKIRQRTDS